MTNTEQTNPSQRPGNQADQQRRPDLATQALMDALQVSFHLLKLIMVVLLVLFLLTGTFTVRPNEVGLVQRFGRVIGTGPDRELKPGFHWALPYPVDRVIRVPKYTQRFVKVPFWYHMTEQEKIRGPSAVAGASLRPGVDDYLISGDANIVHAEVTIRYRIVDAYDYVSSIYGAERPGERPEDFPERTLIESLARDAIIDSAGSFEVDDLIFRKKAQFARSIQQKLSASLAKLNCGLEITDEVLIDQVAPPRQVNEQFIDVRRATEERFGAIKEAQGDAEKLLTETAGTGYRELIQAIEAEEQLLGQETAAARQAAERVSKLLEEAGGSIQDILTDARVYRTTVVEEAKADAKYLQKLLPQYRKNPQVVLTRLLLGMLGDVLGDVPKWYVTKQVKETRFRIDRDPQELAETSGQQQ